MKCTSVSIHCLESSALNSLVSIRWFQSIGFNPFAFNLQNMMPNGNPIKKGPPPVPDSLMSNNNNVNAMNNDIGFQYEDQGNDIPEWAMGAQEPDEATRLLIEQMMQQEMCSKCGKQQGFELPCGHNLCAPCAKTYILMGITSKRWKKEPLKCPSCDGVIPLWVVKECGVWFINIFCSDIMWWNFDKSVKVRNRNERFSKILIVDYSDFLWISKFLKFYIFQIRQSPKWKHYVNLVIESVGREIPRSAGEDAECVYDRVRSDDYILSSLSWDVLDGTGRFEHGTNQ